MKSIWVSLRDVICSGEEARYLVVESGEKVRLCLFPKSIQDSSVLEENDEEGINAQALGGGYFKLIDKNLSFFGRSNNYGVVKDVDSLTDAIISQVRIENIKNFNILIEVADEKYSKSANLRIKSLSKRIIDVESLQ